MTEWTYIEWLDHHSFGDDWINPEDLTIDPTAVCTIGRVIAETKDALVIVPTFWPPTGKISKTHGAMHIIKSCVQKREILSRSNVRSRRSKTDLHSPQRNKTANGRAAHPGGNNSRAD